MVRSQDQDQHQHQDQHQDPHTPLAQALEKKVSTQPHAAVQSNIPPPRHRHFKVA